MDAFIGLTKVAKNGQKVVLKVIEEPNKTFHEIEGTIIEFFSNGLIIDTEKETEFISSDSISTWKIIKNSIGANNSAAYEPNHSTGPTVELTNPISSANTHVPMPNSLNVAVSEDQLELPFLGDPSLPAPEPIFDIPELSDGVRQEIERWRNRYEYAKKVREPARMSQDFLHVAELAESINSPALFYLAGSFAYVSGLGVGRACPYFRISSESGFRPAAIALAAIAIETKEWKNASESLLTALLIKGEIENDATLIRVLGQCMLHSQEKFIPGLGNLLNSDLSNQAIRLLTNLITIIVKSDPDALEFFKQNDLAKLRLTKLGGQLFCHTAKPKTYLNTVSGSFNKTKKLSGSRRGIISTYFPGRGFGFILEDSTGQTWYFKSSSIGATNLIASLESGIIRQDVCFLGNTEIINGKYPLANDVALLATNNTILEEKQKRAPLSLRLSLIPKDGSYYSQAKASEQLDQFEKAEELYRAEITTDGKHVKSAIKDLASLLNRIKKPEAAVEILENYRNKYSSAELTSLDKMKVHFLVNAKLYNKASHLLSQLASKAYPKTKRVALIRQEAYCYFADGKYDTAIMRLNTILSSSPNDNATLLLLDKVKQAKEAGVTIDDTAQFADSFFDEDESMSAMMLGLSTLARMHLDSCELRGVDERSKEKGVFEKRDFESVRNLLSKIKGRRPKEQAGYLLTLSVICEREPELNQSGSMQRYLRWYFAALAEAAMSENSFPDVIRCYSIESLCFHSSKRKDGLENAWALLLGTYFSEKIEPSVLLDKKGQDQIRTIFDRFKNHPDNWQCFLQDASYYKLRIPTAFDEIETLSANAGLKIEFSTSEEKSRLKDEEHTFQSLAKDIISADRLRSSKEILCNYMQKTRFVLDRERMSELIKIYNDAADYVLERHFREKETRFLRLKVEINRIIENMLKFPTHLSIERIHPVLSSLIESLTNDFNRACTAEPSLELSNVLDNDFYTIIDGQVALRLLLTSHNESAPGIEFIDITSDCNGEPCHSADPLHGGQSREVELFITPTEHQINDGVFSVNAIIEYRNRDGIKRQTEPQAIAVRLGSSNFIDITNPYSRYSCGIPVEDKSMFFGRGDLLDKVVHHLSTGDEGQCFVLYGQKRSGKSSFLKQVQMRLAGKVIFVSLAAGTFDSNKLWGSLGRNFMNEIFYQNEKIIENLSFELPSLNDAEMRPIESILNISRMLHKKGHRLVVAIDEFTYIFEKSKNNLEDFMRGWKAILEAKAFSSLLVGQDTMPRFLQAYPNEFGVTHNERISYLSFEEAKTLATKPIMLQDGGSRYRGQAIKKMFDLTAGSPFFLQIMCDRLVTHLNKRNASFITEADIEQVKQRLTVGTESLPPERFDPLVTSAGECVAIIPRDELWNLLSRIARESNHSDWCYRDALSDIPRYREAIKDLIDREVLISEGERVSIRVGLFAAWLRCNY